MNTESKWKLTFNYPDVYLCVCVCVVLSSGAVIASDELWAE